MKNVISPVLQIANSTKEELKPAREMLKRIQQRFSTDFNKKKYSQNTVHFVKLYLKVFFISRRKLHAIGSIEDESLPEQDLFYEKSLKVLFYNFC